MLGVLHAVCILQGCETRRAGFMFVIVTGLREAMKKKVQPDDVSGGFVWS
jgi:hypothetical protein